ncbi:MAG TPA: thiamine pyrophosphate-dependent enzyme [Acidobacteriaceae bacterium]|nr:thiamine pyrophosphate-dependent enzyme [Acidobacteriaceae bacterium]
MATEAGTRVTSATAHGKHGHSLISDAKFRQLYDLALRMQHAGEREQGLRGREAALAGVTADLRDDDVVVAEYAGSVEDITQGHVAVSMERRTFEERVIEALSDAVGDRMRKTGRITAIFFEGTASSRVMQEARAMAIAAKLPVLLVEHLSTKRQRDASTEKSLRTVLEYPSIPVDAQDVIAMYRVAHESIERARDGGGPTHIVSVRWQVAGSAGKRAGKAATQDAVQHLEEWLTARGLPAREWRRAMIAELEKGAREGAGRSQELAFDARNASDREAEDEGAEARAIA